MHSTDICGVLYLYLGGSSHTFAYIVVVIPIPTLQLLYLYLRSKCYTYTYVAVVIRGKMLEYFLLEQLELAKARQMSSEKFLITFPGIKYRDGKFVAINNLSGAQCAV